MAEPEPAMSKSQAKPANAAASPLVTPQSDIVPDEVLMARYQKGEARCFEQLLQRHQKPIFHFALRFLGNQGAAEDALQEIFLRVVKNAARYQRRAKFTTWLYTIARNFCIDESRKARYRRTKSLSDPVAQDSSKSLVETVEGNEQEPDRGAHNQRLKSAIQNAVAELNEEQREVFLLREHSGLAFKEIAEVTGVSENTVKSRMRYALEKLRQSLRQNGFEP